MLQEAILSIPSFHTAANVPYILDDHNRARIFHGSNFVSKNFPWHSQSLLNESNVEILANMGFNTVRLGYVWTGAEPQSGFYNQSYYNKIDEIIALLNKHDIVPFLDVHQDVMSSFFCLYDAFPQWIVSQSDQSSHDFPWPFKPSANGNACNSERGWGANYLSEACGVAFQTLYNEGSSFNQAFTNFWQKTAEHFKDKPILGYEFINEPWAGDIFADPALLTPGHAGRKNLMPFYDRLSETIRAIDNQHLLFYEPVTWGMIFNGTVLGSGLDHVPGGQDHLDKSVFSFHYYCWWYSDLTNDMQRQTCDRLFGPKIFDQVSRETRHRGGAAMLTEWGQACDFNNQNPSDPDIECNQVMDLADKHLIGWTDWYFGERLEGSNFAALTENAQRIFARTYAKIVAGRPTNMQFDVTTKEFRLCFSIEDESLVTSSISEIFVPFNLHYSQGIDIETTPNVEVFQLNMEKNQVLLRNRAMSISDKKHEACVKIAPKTSK
jgi:endoglycosylceramidase